MWCCYPPFLSPSSVQSTSNPTLLKPLLTPRPHSRYPHPRGIPILTLQIDHWHHLHPDVLPNAPEGLRDVQGARVRGVQEGIELGVCALYRSCQLYAG